MKNMYNEIIKSEYIEYKNSITGLPDGYLNRLFSRTADYELFLSKDVCNFTKDEIIDMYKSMNVTSFETLTNINSQLSQYAQYCINNFLVEDFQNHFSEIDMSLMYKMFDISGSEKKIITREQALQIAASYPNFSDGLIILCLFEGIKGKDCSEIRQLKLEDFDGNNVHLVGGRIPELDNCDRWVTVSNELVEYANKAAAENEYTSLTEGQNYVQLAENEDFLVKRTLRAEKYSLQPVFTRRLVKMYDFQDIVPGITTTSIRYSGKIHFCKAHAKRLGISIDEYVLGDHYFDMENQYGDDIPRAVFWGKYKSLLI